MRVVIIGGVAGGMSAATRLRRLDENAEIIVLERSGHVSYANCGLPYYVGGVIAEEDKLYLQTPDSLHKRFRLDVRVNHEVTEISAEKKVVIARDLISGEESELSYDKLILSPGATPVVPPIPGIERALTLRTVEDVLRIYDAVETKPKSAVVIGGGFIGVEMAENLIHKGIKTSLIEALPQVLGPLDPEMAELAVTEGEHLVTGRQGVHQRRFPAAGAGAGRVTCLRHEAGDHPVEHDAIIKPAAHKRLDLSDVLGRKIGPESNRYAPILEVKNHRVLWIDPRRAGRGGPRRRAVGARAARHLRVPGVRGPLHSRPARVGGLHRPAAGPPG